MEGKVVIVRTVSAGVHVGELASRTGREVTLHNATRVWRWRGANTLHELALRGAAQEHTRISAAVPEILLTQATEIIPCTPEAAANLLHSRWPE